MGGSKGARDVQILSMALAVLAGGSIPTQERKYRPSRFRCCKCDCEIPAGKQGRACIACRSVERK